MAEAAGYYLPEDLYYSRRDHLWVRVENGLVRVGMDQVGQKALGSVVYAKVLPPGSTVIKQRAFGAVEAGKFVGPLKSPVNGKVVETNQQVMDNPKLVNTDPYGAGWFALIEPSDLQEDLGDLVHGPEIQKWLDSEIAHYRIEGMLQD